jgi:hypothetical protein
MSIDTGLAIRVGTLLEEHLRAEEERRMAVSRVATGAAFEGWLAIETRLQMESHRSRLGLHGESTDRHGQNVDRFWICNEYSKVDLGILEYQDSFDRWIAAFEFKLVTNNKNWKKKCDGIWADLYPKRGTKKAKINPLKGRFALVAVMGKVFRDAGPYSWRTDLKEWEDEMWEYTLPTSGRWAGEVARVWKSGRFALQDCWLSAEHPGHFVELHALARTDR